MKRVFLFMVFVSLLASCQKSDYHDNRKTIRLLAIGNSYSQDALAYVPFIWNDLGAEVDMTIGILMKSNAIVSDHVDNFINNSARYTFYLYDGRSSWTSHPFKTIQWALSHFQWDIILTHQTSWSANDWAPKYQSQLNQFVNLILSEVDYPVRFAWMVSPARPAQTNGGTNWEEETIYSHFVFNASDAQKVLERTVFDLVIPVGTAIQNARTIPSLKMLGEYANNENNSSGFGYLCAFDGVHLQEGLPCQIAAYSFIISLMKTLGLDIQSLNQNNSVITSSWLSGKSIPGPHGPVILSTVQDREFAKKCAIMANDNPFVVTNIVTEQHDKVD
jgi:hypothetical protein